MCWQMVNSQSTSPVPFELLLEASEEDGFGMICVIQMRAKSIGPVLPKEQRKRLMVSLVHSFPDRGLSWLILGYFLMEQHVEREKTQGVPTII